MTTTTRVVEAEVGVATTGGMTITTVTGTTVSHVHVPMIQSGGTIRIEAGVGAPGTHLVVATIGTNHTEVVAGATVTMKTGDTIEGTTEGTTGPRTIGVTIEGTILGSTKGHLMQAQLGGGTLVVSMEAIRKTDTGEGIRTTGRTKEHLYALRTMSRGPRGGLPYLDCDGIVWLWFSGAAMVKSMMWIMI